MVCLKKKKKSKHFRDSSYLFLGTDTEMLLVTHSQALWGGQGARFKKGKDSIPFDDLSWGSKDGPCDSQS